MEIYLDSAVARSAILNVFKLQKMVIAEADKVKAFNYKK